MSKETPLMKQYNAIKAKHPDALLLFRIGDFYETFGGDAVRASQILDIVLTKRGAGSSSETELAGFPHHSLNTYLPKLVRAGLRVAICDQLEDPKQTKTIVKRGVTELVTPGVSLNDEVLQSKSNNFLAAVYQLKDDFGIAFLDISTGEFLVSEGMTDHMDKLLQNFSPSEILIAKPQRSAFLTAFGNRYNTFILEDWVFQTDYSNEKLNQHFQTKSLKGFGVEDLHMGKRAAAAILHYLSETQHHQLKHISRLNRIQNDDYVWMDRFTIRNLELYHSPHAQATTLLEVIDQTVSPMGARLLKRWLALPLKNIKTITKRHDAVDFFLQNEDIQQTLKSYIGQVGDLERLISKVATGKINPREMVQLKNALGVIQPLKTALSAVAAQAVRDLALQLDSCTELSDKIKLTLNEEAPVNILKGGAVSSEASEELKELRSLATDGKTYLDAMLERESERTKIPSLKIASNNVFGYYIEVRNTHKDKVPEDWIRKQTLVNAERYITEELKTYESKILSAEDRIAQLELELFTALVQWTIPFISAIQKTAQAIAQLDVLNGFSLLAKLNAYCRPAMNRGKVLSISQGRHPVIEKQLPSGENYVPNDLLLDPDTQQFIMITGPNMSGKSAILRQTALIVLLAQMGSFVPATAAEIGLVDKIFTRVGASDNISMGESTFMVEMNETSAILNNITENSLVLLDEIGRGTSTYDGISIAWAISVYLHQHSARPKTLFATHYHELNEMTEKYTRIKNYNVSFKELDDQVLFLRKLVPGGSAHSFGIHVAKMAGMPQQVLAEAQSMLKRLEQNRGAKSTTKGSAGDLQLSFFNLDDPILEDIRDQINALDIDTLTPVEALMQLNQIKRLLQNKK